MKKTKANTKLLTANLTENQHYVWRSYLKNWTVGNYLYYFRRENNDVRRASPKKIARSSFFYAAERLEQADLRFLQILISQFKNPKLRELAEGWIETLQLPFKGEQFLQRLNLPEALLEKAKADMDYAAKMMIEQLHGRLETDAAPLLKLLQERNLAFLENVEERNLFINFITNQYFRTEKMRLALPFSRSPIEGHEPNRTALVESLIFANNVGASIVAHWDKYRTFIIESDEAAPFITGDQPVINLLGEQGGPTGDAIELYYPLSPRRAFLFSPDKAKFPNDGFKMDAQQTDHLNMMILKQSERDVYCNSEEYLIRLINRKGQPPGGRN